MGYILSNGTPDHTPLELTQGVSYEWTLACGDYAPADGWTATMRILSSADSLVITSTADPDSGDYLFAITAAQSAALYAGSYRYQVTTTDGTDTHLVENGYIYVLAGLATEQPEVVSGKSPARQRLEHYQKLVMQEAFVKTLGTGQLEEIEGAIRRLEWEVKREEDSERVRRGMNATRKLYTRFT